MQLADKKLLVQRASVGAKNATMVSMEFYFVYCFKAYIQNGPFLISFLIHYHSKFVVSKICLFLKALPSKNLDE